MWPIKSSQGRPGRDRRDESGTAKPWSYGGAGSVMEVRYVKPLTSLAG